MSAAETAPGVAAAPDAPAAGVPVLELEGVTKSYGGDPPVHALRGVDLTVREGELIAIAGPSGSGKSTLLHMIGTLDRPTDGVVRVAGFDISEMSDRQLAALRSRRIGFVFQQFFLAEHETLLDNVGNGLLYVQAHDPQHDGRIRAAYAPAPLLDPADVTVTDPASLAGNLAWAGQALVRLYAATGHKAYLTGAEAIGNWVQAHCYDTRGPGGYTGGEDARGQKIPWKSTEHNIDLYALFTMLAAQTRDPVWSVRAAWARSFVTSMWNPRQGRFYVGTTADGATPNDSVMPEDVNSWSYLALRDPRYAASLSWDVRNLAVSAGGATGVSFCSGDRTGVWYEGTAHLADALEFRGQPGDAALAAQYLSDIYHAQAHGPGTDHRGIIAASRNGLGDCGGGTYSASLHTGTTAWYILAARKINPFVIQTASPAHPATAG